MFNNLITYAIDSIDLKIQSENKSVCELGNQTLKNNSSRARIFRNRNITKEVNTVKEYYEAIGFKRYLAIDVNENLDAVAMDLNLDIRKEYNFTEQFDLVTNNGTGEHIFNQYMVFKNTHNLCKVGGYMIHQLPSYRWMDHGFFNFNPNLFAALALQNEYELVHCWFGTSNAAKRFETTFTLQRNKKYVSMFKMNEWEDDPQVSVVLRKTKDSEFQIPVQHMYSGDNIQSAEIKSRYK